jgi:hypothetical protein
VSSFARSPVGGALGGILKNVAKKALPIAGGALGSLVAPGIGTALGSKLGSMASDMFEVELEAMEAEQAEFEVARRVVRTATAATHQAAMARPRPGTSPQSVARAAVAKAARGPAPGVYRQMMHSLHTTVQRRPGARGTRGAPRATGAASRYRGYAAAPRTGAARAGRRPYGAPSYRPSSGMSPAYGRAAGRSLPGARATGSGQPVYAGSGYRYYPSARATQSGQPVNAGYGYRYQPGSRPSRPRPYSVYGYQPAYREPWQQPWDSAEPWVGAEEPAVDGYGRSGRWVRRGRKILLLGV